MTSSETILQIIEEKFKEAERSLRLLYFVTGDKKHSKRASKLILEREQFVVKFREEHGYEDDLPF